jgi:hypothetical protein
MLDEKVQSSRYFPVRKRSFQVIIPPPVTETAKTLDFFADRSGYSPTTSSQCISPWASVNDAGQWGIATQFAIEDDVNPLAGFQVSWWIPT